MIRKSSFYFSSQTTCADLLSFVSLLLPPTDRQSTPHIKKTLNPVFPAEASTFDLPLYLSMAGVISGRGLEAVMWDKVRFLLDRWRQG